MAISLHRFVSKRPMGGRLAARSIIRGGIPVLFAMLLVVVTQASFALTEPTLNIITPTDNASTWGHLEFRAKLEHTDIKNYNMYWSVDNGSPNKMSIDPATGVGKAYVDVSSWSWSETGYYTIGMKAISYDNSSTIAKSIKIQVKKPVDQPRPISSPAPANPAPKTSVSAPVAQATQAVNNPLGSQTLFADPNNATTLAAQSWAEAHPNDAENMKRYASQPKAVWAGGWDHDVQGKVNDYVSQATAAKSLATIVVYNIPYRDCGSYSAGGANSSTAYLEWVRKVNAGIANRKAIVIIEPDALAQIDCLPKGAQQERYSMLHEASRILASNPSAYVYLDAGHSRWVSAQEMSRRLVTAGIGEIQGFSLNVSNYQTTEANISYGKQISSQTGNKHFVIDTSRNGNGAKGQEWCTPSGRKLGANPSLTTNDPLVDAYLWVKNPGESDGACGSVAGGTYAPSAGAWWPQYLVSLF